MRLKTYLPMYVFTSQIPTLDFAEVGIDPLEVTVWAGRDKLLETTMYPVAGKIYLHDLGDLYEVAARNRLIIDSEAAFSVLGRCKMVLQTRLIEEARRSDQGRAYPYRRNCR